jgi:argininosuccinate lyase
VRHAISRGSELADLPLEELRQFSSLIGRDVYPALTVEASLRARAAAGGTAPDAVRQQLAQVKALLARGPGA